MYGWIWARLPGPLAARLALAAVLLAVAVVVLWFAVFPAVESRLPYSDVTVDTPAASTPSP